MINFSEWSVEKKKEALTVCIDLVALNIKLCTDETRRELFEFGLDALKGQLLSVQVGSDEGKALEVSG